MEDYKEKKLIVVFLFFFEIFTSKQMAPASSFSNSKTRVCKNCYIILSCKFLKLDVRPWAIVILRIVGGSFDKIRTLFWDVRQSTRIYWYFETTSCTFNWEAGISGIYVKYRRNSASNLLRALSFMEFHE